MLLCHKTPCIQISCYFTENLKHLSEFMFPITLEISKIVSPIGTWTRSDAHIPKIPTENPSCYLFTKPSVCMLFVFHLKFTPSLDVHG